MTADLDMDVDHAEARALEQHHRLVGPVYRDGKRVNDVKATVRIWLPDWLAAPDHTRARMIEFSVAFERASIPAHLIARAGALVDLQRSNFPSDIMTQLMRFMGDIKHNVVFLWNAKHLAYWTTGMTNVVIDLRDDCETDPLPFLPDQPWQHVIRCDAKDLLVHWPA